MRVRFRCDVRKDHLFSSCVFVFFLPLPSLPRSTTYLILEFYQPLFHSELFTPNLQ